MQIREYQYVVTEQPMPTPVTMPNIAAGIIAPIIGRQPVEHFGVLTLDTKHRMIAWQHLTVGTLDASIVHPRDVFRAAVLDNAAAVIVGHNHPSGDVRPSPDDIALTKRLMTCGEVMGIPVLDHVIVGYAGINPVFASLKGAQ